MFGRLLSFFISTSFHLAVFAAVLFWPAPAPQLPAGPTVIASGLVSFAPKEGKSVPSPLSNIPEARQGRQEPAQQRPQNAQEQPNVTPIERRDTSPSQNRQEPTVVEKAADPVVPKDDPNAAPIPEDPEKTEPKTEPKSEPKTEPKSEPGENLNSAPADLRRQTGQRGGDRNRGAEAGSGRGESLADALADLGKEVGNSGSGNEGTGAGSEGGTGYGLAGAYADSVVSRIRPNWSWPGRTDRANYVAVVNIKIAADGLIQSSVLKTPSGNSFFDATVLRAVQATRQLEPPPSPAYMDMDISFSPSALAGR